MSSKVGFSALRLGAWSFVVAGACLAGADVRAADFGGPQIELGVGGSFADYHDLYQSGGVSLWSARLRFALSDGLQAHWGGVIRAGVGVAYQPNSHDVSQKNTFCLPTDTVTCTGTGSLTQKLRAGFSLEGFVEPGYALNEHVAIFAHGGYECGSTSWSQTWDYNGVSPMETDRTKDYLCGPTVGGRIVINPAHLPELSIGAFYRYAEGSRRTYTNGTNATVYGPTQNEIRTEVTWIIPL